MSRLTRLMASILEILPITLEMFLEVSFDRLPELRLVVLEADDEIATAVDDVARDLFLTAHGIDRDQGVGQIDLLQELGNRRDFVGFLLGRDLAQGDPLLAGPGADDVQGAELLRRVVGPPTRLAVDGNQPVRTAVVGPDRAGDPVLEALLKRLGLERDQQSPNAIARRDSVGKRK